MAKVHIERLRTLYSIVAGIPEHRLDLETWRRNRVSGNTQVSDEQLAESVRKNECGTVACAVGWATMYPEFVKQGFKTDKDGWPIYARRKNSATREPGRFESWASVESFFGLTDKQAEHIFAEEYKEDGISGKRHVLKQIRLLLLKKGVITAERSVELSIHEEQGTLA